MDSTGGHEDRAFPASKGWKQRRETSVCETCPQFPLNKDILEDGKDIIVVARVKSDKNLTRLRVHFVMARLHNILKNRSEWFAKWVLIQLIKICRVYLSCIGSHCIFIRRLTLQYAAMEAIKKYGAIKGVLILLAGGFCDVTCLVKGGYDPVLQKTPEVRYGFDEALVPFWD